MGIAARLLFGALAFRASMETSLSEPASGRSAGAISTEAVLKAACARPLENGVFLEAGGYPGGMDCRLEAEVEPIAGVFVVGSRLELLPYNSNREPHVHNWGGSLVVAIEGESIRLAGYLVGLSGIDGCLFVGSPASQQSFVCRYRYVGLGYERTSVAGYSIIKNPSGYAFRMIELAKAADAAATFGALLVRCGRDRELIGIDTP